MRGPVARRARSPRGGQPWPTAPSPTATAASNRTRRAVAELTFGARDQIAYTTAAGDLHVVRVERLDGHWAIVDRHEGRSIVIEEVGRPDTRAAADALALDWAIQARLHHTGRRDTDPTPLASRVPSDEDDGQLDLLAA